MTYILGSVCSDGVVLIGDRRITSGDGTTHEYDDKIFQIDPYMFVGSSGTLALFQKFRNKVTEYINSPNCERTVEAITDQIESITRQLNESYQGILRGQDFDVLFGIKSTVSATLNYIYPYGLAEVVGKYRAIGHGEPYGVFFLRHWWRPEMTMLEVAELGFFIIRYIQEFELDNTVGISEENPQIILIPSEPLSDNHPSELTQQLFPHSLAETDMHDIANRVQRRITRLKRMSWSMR